MYIAPLIRDENYSLRSCLNFAKKYFLDQPKFKKEVVQFFQIQKFKRHKFTF